MKLSSRPGTAAGIETKTYINSDMISIQNFAYPTLYIVLNYFTVSHKNVKKEVGCGLLKVVVRCSVNITIFSVDDFIFNLVSHYKKS